MLLADLPFSKSSGILGCTQILFAQLHGSVETPKPWCKLILSVRQKNVYIKTQLYRLLLCRISIQTNNVIACLFLGSIIQ